MARTDMIYKDEVIKELEGMKICSKNNDVEELFLVSQGLVSLGIITDLNEEEDYDGGIIYYLTVRVGEDE